MEDSVEIDLTAAIEQFQRDGATIIKSVLDQQQLACLADAVEHNMAHPGPWANDYTPASSQGRFFGDYVRWQDIDGYRESALRGPLPLLAAHMMGEPSPRFFHEHTLVKEPGTNEITPWHHDEPYYCVDSDHNVSLWVSLDPVPAAAGLTFVAGSHDWGRSFVPRKFLDYSPYAAADNGYELVPDIDNEIGHSLISFDVEPGDVIAFRFRTLHSAPGTAGLTSNRRRAVSFRYLGSDAVFATRPWLHSPPYDNVVPGQPLDDARFPLTLV